MLLHLSGGGIAQAADDGGTTTESSIADHILASQQDIKDSGYGISEGKSYWYGVVGGNAYVDSTTQYEDDFTGEVSTVAGGLKGTMSGLGTLASLAGVDLSDVTAVLDKTTSAEAGQDTVINGDAGLSMGIPEVANPSVVRFHGAVGGDLSVNTGLKANGEEGGLELDLSGTKTDLLKETTDTSIVRNGNIINNLGGTDEEGNILSGGSYIGGVGGSASAALGNMTVEGSYSTTKNIFGTSITATVSADLMLDGKTSATINGDVTTNVAKDTNVIGWMNGGLAAGIGGEAASTVNGDTVLNIDGTDRTIRESGFEKPGDDDILPQLTTALNVMEGSGISAIGVMGGGSAVTTLGGTAESTVTGTSTINIKDATVLGTIGGGLAASVDATGAAEQIYKPDGKEQQYGNDDGTVDVTGVQLEALLGMSIPDDFTITATDAIDGGTATSTTGDTYVNLTGSSTAVGVLGGGAAVASHTYTWKADKTNETDTGYTTNDEFGSSTATAETGRSHITVALTKDAGFDGEANGWKVKSGMLNAVKSFVNKVVNDTNDLQADELEALHNKGVAVGIFGGGAAIAQSGNRQFVDEENKDQALSTTDGAFATASTAGSDIALAGGYIAGVMGGGIAAVDNNATATAEMTDTVNITIGGYVDEEGNELDPEVVGVFGNGLAYYTGSSNGGQNELKGQAVASAKDTNILVRSGSVDGIIGGGMAIDDSQADVTNAIAKTDGTVNITVTGGTVNKTNLSAMTGLVGDVPTDSVDMGSYFDGVVAAAGDAAIAAGGIALGGGAQAEVADAVVNIAGDAVVDGNIYGGGIAAYGWENAGGSKVDSSTINLMGGTVDGNVYAGGAIATKTSDGKDVYSSYDQAVSTVDTSVINWGDTEVTGILSGQGTVDQTASDSEQVKVGESTLNIIGTHTLSTVKSEEGESQTESSKIQGFNNVNFAAGSETIVEDLTAGESGTAVIDGGTVTVGEGARLNIENLDTGFENEGTSGNSYNIAANTSDSSTFWKDSDLVYDRMSGVYATTEVTNGTEGESDTSFQVKYEKITADNADEAADSMTEALGAKDLRSLFREGMLDGWENAGEGAKGYFEEWQAAPELNAQYGRGMLIGEDAAVTGNTVSIARAMADNVTQRLSFTEDYVQEPGSAMQDGGVWAKYMHRKYETDGMGSSFGGIHSSTDYDGILVGVDFAKKGNFQSGIAIHYGDGEGDGLISHNDYDAWGITLYGSLKDEEAGTNLMADIGWMTSDNDIDGTVGSQRLTANRDVDAWTVGVRGEKEFVSGRNQIVPYAGLRYMSVNPGSYTVYSNGEAAFESDADNQNLWLLPVGVSFRNETVTAGGWKITPKLDVSYIWAFGDTDTDMTVNAGSYGSTLYYDVTDDSSWLASLGVEAEKDAWTFGVSYGYQKGDDTKNKTWFVTAGYSF